jgi:hypothetical protein
MFTSDTKRRFHRPLITPFLSLKKVGELIGDQAHLHQPKTSTMSAIQYQAYGEEDEEVFEDGDMNFGVQGGYEGTYNEAESGKSI